MKESLEVLFEGVEIKVHGKFGHIPKQAEPGAAGFDLYAPSSGGDIYMPYGTRRMVDTGVIVQTPIKLFMLLVPRSSTGTKVAKSVRIANTVGVIDPSYQGQGDTIKVCLEREARKKEFKGSIQQESADGLREMKTRILEAAGRGEEGRGIQIRREGEGYTLHRRKGLLGCRGVKQPFARAVATGEGAYDVFSYPLQEEGSMVIEAGTRFAQVIFLPYARPLLVEAALEEFGLDRGGFGSTGR